MSKSLASNIMQALTMEVLGPEEGMKAVQSFEEDGGFGSYGGELKEGENVVAEALEKSYPALCGFGLAALIINDHSKEKSLDMTIREVIPMVVSCKNMVEAFWTTVRYCFKIPLGGLVGIRSRNGSIVIYHNPSGPSGGGFMGLLEKMGFKEIS